MKSISVDIEINKISDSMSSDEKNLLFDELCSELKNEDKIEKILSHSKNKILIIPHIPFPVSLSTSDMIGYTHTNGDIKILLGRKPHQTKYQFPGGFRDPGETSQEAAKREYKEEVTLDLHTNRFKFIKEMFVNDARYQYSVHKVTTAIFVIKLTEEEINNAVAGDDLAELKVFSLEELKNGDLIVDIHVNIFNVFADNLVESIKTI
jgi:8-oxo-dGTP pyrophosphatase MutT (NUDIX family)